MALKTNNPKGVAVGEQQCETHPMRNGGWTPSRLRKHWDQHDMEVPFTKTITDATGTYSYEL
jgi:hypothetical protein